MSPLELDVGLQALLVILPLLVIFVVIVALLAAWRRAVRIDRLHLAVLTARAALDLHAERRAQSARVFAATAGRLPPAPAHAVAEAAGAAEAALDLAGAAPVADGLDGRAPEPEATQRRAAAERRLTAALDALRTPDIHGIVGDDPDAAAALAALEAARFQLDAARRFHDTRVAQVHAVRSGFLTRALRLAGRAPLPQAIGEEWGAS